MLKAISVVTFSIILLFAVSAIAANKVLVIPLNTCKDPDLLPENICLSVTICGVTGKKACPRDTYGTVTSAGQVWMDRNLGRSGLQGAKVTPLPMAGSTDGADQLTVMRVVQAQ